MPDTGGQLKNVLRRLAVGEIHADRFGTTLRSCFTHEVLCQGAIANKLGVPAEQIVQVGNGMSQKQVKKFCASLDLK